MESALEGYDFVLGAVRGARSAHFSAEFDGGFVGFAAGITDEGFGRARHCACLERFLYKELGEGADPGVVVEVGSVHKSLRLLVEQFRHFGIAVAECVNRYPCCEVEVAAVFNVP